MQLLMRRPEIEEFVSIAAPANRFDFSFLARCPRSDLFIHGDLDRVAAAKGSHGAHRKAENLQGRRHRACRRARGQPHLRGQARAADFGKWAPISTNGSASLRASPSRSALRATVIGFEQSRLAMVLAVLEAHGVLKLEAFVEDFAKHQSWAHSILSILSAS
jgi:hypothetical protein